MVCLVGWFCCGDFQLGHIGDFLIHLFFLHHFEKRKARGPLCWKLAFESFFSFIISSKDIPQFC